MSTLALKGRILPWLLAARPKTLPAAFAPVAVAAGLSYNAVGGIDPFLAASALLFALAIQVATNLVNDALDFERGADTSERLGPSRITQQGLYSSKQVLAAGVSVFFLALLFSIPLIAVGGAPIALVVFLSIASGYLYTGGPYPLAYVGLGDLFVLLFFGLVSVGATFYILTGTYSSAAFAAGTAIGSLATVIIAINNLRDRKGDEIAGKRTLAVRFGPLFARCEITLLLLAAYSILSHWWAEGNYWAALLPLATLPLAVRIAFAVWKEEPSARFNGYLAMAGLLELSFGLLLVLGLIIQK